MRTLRTLLIVVTGLVLGVTAWGWYDYTRPGPLEEAQSLYIGDGSGAREIARKLAQSGVIRHEPTFLVAIRITDRHDRLQAGEYAFPSGISVRSVIDKLVAGDTVVHRLTVAEGLTTAEVLALIEGTEGLTGPVPSAKEGELLPDTYHFSRGDSRAKLVERMREAMDATRERVWANRDENLPLRNASELVTLASIVEKETGLTEERARVAAVFLNRLRLGMPLQSDPTVVYALERNGTVLDRPLMRSDLSVDSPYNTYGNNGLPPGPIANPGLAAMKAVAHPDETDELYFVADGTGGHAFARTLTEHNQNVRRLRELQRRSGASQN